MAQTHTRIGVLMGGRSAERAISLKTGQAICQALVRRGYRAVPIDADASLPWQLRAKKVDMAFIALHGPGGEDGTIQGLLEVLGVPYTGSGVRASAIAMDKPSTKALLHSYGIAVPGGAVLQAKKGGQSPPTGLKWPVIVKPASQGSTIGITIVRRTSQWRAALRCAYEHDAHVMVESYIAGREMAISVLDGVALPAVEILAPDGFYDYGAKYEKAETQYRCPAPLSREAARRLGALAVRSYEVVGCEGAARADFRINRRGKPFVLEINTIPGMTERSLLPMAAAQAGMDYDTLTEHILESARRRQRTVVRRNRSIDKGRFTS